MAYGVKTGGRKAMFKEMAYLGNVKMEITDKEWLQAHADAKGLKLSTMVRELLLRYKAIVIKKQGGG